MNTPTPRTDKLSVSLLRKTFLTSYVAMKEHACTLERELTHAREINAGSEANVAFLREELERERAKVRTLREACERIEEQWDKNHSANPFHAGNVMQSHAMRALAETEDAQ